MRIALLSDIHGNLIALNAVLDELANAKLHNILCLGDVAVFGPQPQAALRRVQELGCPVIMGNTDSWVLTPVPYHKPDEVTPLITAIDTWGADQLDENDRAFIQTFQPTMTLALPGKESLLAYHGSPLSFNDRILPGTSEDELAHVFAGQSALLMVGGHTHTQMVRRFRESLVVNPGSVGMPYEYDRHGTSVRNPSWAEYGIVTFEFGRCGIELCRVGYDVDGLLAAARESGMPHVDWWSKDWH